MLIVYFVVVFILGISEMLVGRKSNGCACSLPCTHIINHFVPALEMVQGRCTYSKRKWAISRGICCAFLAVCGDFEWGRLIILITQEAVNK